MAPDPGTRMVWISVRFGMLHFLLHDCKEFPKNIMRVMRTRPGFRMELHTENRLVFYSQAFERVIVQTFICDFHFLWIQVAFGNTIIVILRSDQHLSAWQILNGVISAMMAKLESMGLCSQCPSD